MWQDYLTQLDPYYQTLVNPFEVHGVKIPDLEGAPSGVVTLMNRMTITVGGNGVAGAAFGVIGATGYEAAGSLVPLKFVQFTGSTGAVQAKPPPPTGPKGVLCPTQPKVRAAANPSPMPAVVSYDRAWDQAVGFLVEDASDIFTAAQGSGLGDANALRFSNWTNDGDGSTFGHSAMTDLYTRARLVSFGAQVQFLGNYTQASGRIVAASVGRQSVNRAFLPTLTADDIALLPGARVVPVNQLGGASVVYRPTDNRSFQYTDLDQYYFGDIALPMVDARSFWNDNVEALGGELYLIITGATAGSTFELTWVGNYEVGARTGAISMSAMTPSPSDPIALGHIMNRLQYESPAKPLKPMTSGADMTPMLVHQEQPRENWFDKLIKGINSAMPVVGSVIKMFA